MPEYNYVITKKAKDDLNVLPAAVRRRVGGKLLFFINSSDPLSYAQKLTKRQDGDYRFRVGVYRVVFDKSDKTLYILRVQHRKEVYRR